MRKSKQTFFVKVYCYKLKDFVFCMNDIFVNSLINVNIDYC